MSKTKKTQKAKAQAVQELQEQEAVEQVKDASTERTTKEAHEASPEEKALEEQVQSYTQDLSYLTNAMDTLYQDRARIKFELKNIEQEIQKNELRLQAILEELGVSEMKYNVYSFGWENRTTNRLNQNLLKEQYPDQYRACYTPCTSKSFVFKVN